MELFEKATKEKDRWETSKGMLSAEDLWDLSLPSLDTIAKAVNKKLKEESEESFISAKTSSNETLERKLNVLKHIIGVKLAEKEATKSRMERLAKIHQLKELAVSKANEQLASKSLEEIQKMIAELEE
jgi:hypothetical protein